MITSARAPILAGLALLALTVPALAHAHLKSAVPAMNAKVQNAPTELRLGFSEGVNLKFTGVTITGPDKQAISTGAASLAAGGDTTLVVPVSTPLPAGTYMVDWHALATDGHKTNGSYAFTVAP